jgi:hypothetical protein
MRRHRKYLIIVIIILLVLSLARIGYKYGRSVWGPVYVSVRGQRQVSAVSARIGPSARARLQPYFDHARILYPSTKVSFLAFKQEKTLELWAERGPRWVYIRTYPVLAASGSAGPKLRQGDRQVPEGIYRVDWLNPNSSYYLSIKINYPNNFDRQKAALDKRTNLGGDIFIHGKDVSIGCLAIGDEAIEELFTLVNDIGLNQVRVIIAPNDMRKAAPVVPDPNIPWLPELYGILTQELKEYR